MKILSANHRYFVSGGPETYMFAVTDLLEKAGHEVVPFSVRYSRNRQTPWSEYFVDPIAGKDEVFFREHSRSLRSLTRGLQRSFYARDVYAAVSRLAAVCRPDVALVQHFLRKLSPSLLVALSDVGVPIVVRLSDFSMVCPEAHLLRDGQVCRRCLTGGLSSCLRYRCVQGSLGVSAVAGASLWLARRRRYFDLVDTFIAPSAIMREEMIAGGFDGERIVVLPTFVDATGFEAGAVRERRLVYVGRLSPEKGVEVLLDAFEKLIGRQGLGDVELHIAGDGDDADYVARVTARGRQISPQVKFLGALDAGAVRRLLSSALVSVVPSLWYENLPNALLESLAAGTPVAATDLGSMRDVLRGTEAGLLFGAGDAADLADGLAGLLSRPDRLMRMSEAARSLAESVYSPQVHLAGLTGVLERACKRTPVTTRPTGVTPLADR